MKTLYGLGVVSGDCKRVFDSLNGEIPLGELSTTHTLFFGSNREAVGEAGVVADFAAIIPTSVTEAIGPIESIDVQELLSAAIRIFVIQDAVIMPGSKYRKIDLVDMMANGGEGDVVQHCFMDVNTYKEAREHVIDWLFKSRTHLPKRMVA